MTDPLQFAFERGAPLREVLLIFLFLEPGFDLGAGALGLDQSQIGIQPVTAGTTAFRGQNLDLIASLELLVQGNKFPVDSRAPAAMTDVCVNVVSKVDRRGPG